ncbi:NAD-dependent epimerase/dehydratase family protein [Halomonas sp. KRD171]|uniref:NAD-dependent epimerase/dehydratase family protein n=1 Tax=Halomonas sp. KRD171 TaxID=2729726 RepID=UPI0013733A6E|nr:NAD-dependent epimerase/dehydratase family protein [Halomonas sp. KRD171]NAO98996.1 NAD-dependent epimerase/dehydratase family protein [Halomonas sp. MG34]
MAQNNVILITGGCGFIGTSLIDALLQGGCTQPIRVLDSLVTGSPEDLAEVTEFETLTVDQLHTAAKQVVLVQGDIRDITLTEQVAQGVSTIVHLAANTGVGPSVEDPRLDMECNVVGTFNMLEAARKHGVKKFVFASSGAPAGEVEPPIHEELPPHPVSPYGSSKLAGEGYCSSYNKTFGIDTICLRFGNVYGPRSKNKASVVAKFIKQALAGETCAIYGDGSQTRDFIYIFDLIRAIQAAMEAPVGGETFQIATGKERTVGEVAELIAKNLEAHGKSMQITHEAKRLGDVMRNYSDTTKAKTILGWQTQMDINEGIGETIRWFLAR